VNRNDNDDAVTNNEIILAYLQSRRIGCVARQTRTH